MLRAAALALALLGAPAAALEYGFQSDLSNGVLRSEYATPEVGSAAQPLRLDCNEFPEWLACDAQTTFEQTYAYTSVPGWPTSDFWMLVVNNDETFYSRCDLGGPPDQALPLSAPGGGLSGVAIVNGVLHLDTNQVDFVNPCGSSAAPFVGAGRFWKEGEAWGNDRPLGYLNAEPAAARTTFSAQVVEYRNGGGYHYARAWVWAQVEWDGVDHMMAYHYYAIDEDDEGNVITPNGLDGYSLWYWPYLDSYFYGGSEVAVAGPEKFNRTSQMIKVGFPAQVTVDWQVLFARAKWSTPLPTDRPLAIKVVAWANELVGLNRLYTKVWNVRQGTLPSLLESRRPR